MHAQTAGILMAILLAFSARAQYPMSANAQKAVISALENPSEAEKLKCELETLKPSMDFAFRFQAGYVLRCPVKIFGGQKGLVATYIRITPDGGKPLFLSEAYSVPEMPADLRNRTNVHKLSQEFEFSGGFSMGEGHYAVDVLVVDSSTRVLHKHWDLRAVRTHDERNVQVAMPALTAAPLYNRSWNGKMTADGKGLRVTILLNAAPRDPRATRLRAWDRAMLIDSLSSMLRAIPTESVRLVAFNLEQQREIFRDERLDRPGLGRLGRSLRELELGTVSYSVLKNHGGWAEMLSSLTNQEVEAEEPSDVVIFVGPMSRNLGKVPAEYLTPAKGRRPHFYYFEFLPMWRRGNELPDVISHTTSARSGTTLKIHTPGELGQAIQKLMDQTRKEQSRQQLVISSGIQ
jgi:hypothetical protein